MNEFLLFSPLRSPGSFVLNPSPSTRSSILNTSSFHSYYPPSSLPLIQQNDNFISTCSQDSSAMCTHYSEGDNFTSFSRTAKKKTADLSPAPPNLWLLVWEFLKQSVLKTPALEYNMLSSWCPQAVCKTSIIQVTMTCYFA